MSDLLIPRSAAEGLIAERRRGEAELAAQLQLQSTLDRWNRELRELDRNLQMVKAMDNATDPRLRPGFFHIVRRNDAAPPTIIPIEDPETGEFVEPTARVFDMLQYADFWDPRTHKEQARLERQLEESKRRQRDRDVEERHEEIKDRIKAAVSPGVRFGGSWTAKAGAVAR